MIDHWSLFPALQTCPSSLSVTKVSQYWSNYLTVSFYIHVVFPGTEEQIYNDPFFRSLDIVVNALDNIEARRYVDRCIACAKLRLLCH